MPGSFAHQDAGSDELRNEAEELCDLLGERLHHYEDVLRENGFEMPYVRATQS